MSFFIFWLVTAYFLGERQGSSEDDATESAAKVQTAGQRRAWDEI